VYISLNTQELRDAFFSNYEFAVDVTRIAAEWAGTETWTNGVQLIINAGSNSGTAWGIYTDLGWRASWNFANGNNTTTASWDYRHVLPTINRNNLEWLELIFVTNYSDTAYTQTGSYYLDDAHFFPGLPLLGDWEQRRDGWYFWEPPQVTHDYDAVGATLHDYSFKLTGTQAGWRNGPVLDMAASAARIDAFLANDVFSVDLTRLASEWTPDPAVQWPGCTIHFIVNAGFDDGTASIWGDCGGAGNWDSRNGDWTTTLSWNYSAYKQTISDHRTAISWFQLVMCLNNWGYTAGFVYHLDNARLSPPPPQPQGFYTINNFDTADEVVDPTTQAAIWFQQNPETGPPTTLEWDPTVDADNSPTSGSLKVTVAWDPNSPPAEWQTLVARDVFPGGENIPSGADLSAYSYFRAKVKVDPSSPMDVWGAFGWSNWVFRSIGWSWDQWAGSGANLDTDGPLVDANGWMSFNVFMSGDPAPVPPRDLFRALTYQLGGSGERDGTPWTLDGTTIFWIDSISVGRFQPCHDQYHCEICNNRVDDNDDGLVDCLDSDCPGTTVWCPLETVCDDGFDGEDLDGLVDCADPDCAADPNCTHNDPFADMDNDGDVDHNDFGLVQVCLSAAPVPRGCGFLDRDADQDVDGQDLLAFEACASGPGIPADKACDDER